MQNVTIYAQVEGGGLVVLNASEAIGKAIPKGAVGKEVGL